MSRLEHDLLVDAIGIPEQDPEAERWRAALAALGCRLFRQWGQSTACAITLGGVGDPVVIEEYRDGITLAAETRKACLRRAYELAQASSAQAGAKLRA